MSEAMNMRLMQQSVAYSRIHLGWISLLTATSTNNKQLEVILKWKQCRQRSIQACIPKAPHSNCYTSMWFTSWAISERVKTNQRSLCCVYIAGMIITIQTSGKLLVSLLPMIKIKPEAMDSAIATVEVMDCAMVMNARHSSAQLNDSRDTGVHYGVFTGTKLFNNELCPHRTKSPLRAIMNEKPAKGKYGCSPPIQTLVSDDLICWCITHVCCLS